MNNPILKETISDYVNIFNLDLNLNQLKIVCTNIGNYIEKEIKINHKTWYENKGCSATPYTTKVFNEYNLLSFVQQELHDVYKCIKSAFNQLPKKEEDFYIQCWLNIYKTNTALDWHSHWEKEYESWHGYICVDVEPSITSYKLPYNNEIIDIQNKNNTLVISRSDGDKHKTNIWDDSSKNRITIAFDILPVRTLNTITINHWVPI